MKTKIKQYFKKDTWVIVGAVAAGLALVVMGTGLVMWVTNGEKAPEELPGSEETISNEDQIIEVNIEEWGEGKIASSGATLAMKYAAKTEEGEVLYATPDEEKLSVKLDSARIPYALNRVLMGMTEGSKLTILVPAADTKGLELGEMESGTVPIVLEVELVTVSN